MPFSQARALLGWQPRVTLEEGLTTTVEDFRRRLAAHRALSAELA
jgi:nucleoside-diphosphate-sugar epimerase